jgi:hypothetical protein
VVHLSSICLGIILTFALSSNALAEHELVVNAAEFGVAKFHRADNKAHAYGADNAWSVYILPDNMPTDHVQIIKNNDDNYSVFYSTLDEMLSAVVQISQSDNRPVAVLNIHGHGLPGAMWFPKDEKALNGIGCSQWLDAASGSDADNISQYYSALSFSEIRQIRQMSNASGIFMPCTTGLKEWQQGVQKNLAVKAALAADIRIHFLSCVVGLGRLGDEFTKGIAALLVTGNGHVTTSMNFGLGDWSMPEGMGFWDYQNDQQLEHDNSVYPVNHRDSEIAQLGSLRLATAGSSSSVLANQRVMPLGFDSLVPGAQSEEFTAVSAHTLPASVRVPGTNARVQLLRQ